jgi:hypothetical protein
MNCQKKKWTMMVYLAGDNNLDNNGVIDLKEMKKTGSTPDLNVIAQFDRAGAGVPTSRYYLKKDTSLDADAVQSLAETNSGSPDALLDFIKWGVTGYPAEHYLLVLWNHGQGWDDTDIYAEERGAGARLLRSSRVRHAFFRSSVVEAAKLAVGNGKTTRAILLDDNAKDFLDNLEMKNVLKAAKKLLGRKLDIVGMDACLMSMAEVGYQMRESVCYTVGSEQTEPLDGWPYDTILAALSKKPGMPPDILSKTIAQNYIASYKGSSDAVTHSACDLTTSTEFAGSVKKLATALKAGLTDGPTKAAISDARNRVQEYEVADNVDLVDFCRLLGKAAVPDIIKTACNQVITALRSSPGIVIASGYYGSEMKGSKGVAIYFPTRTVSPLYSKLDFKKKTGWGTFLKKFVAVTHSR